MVGQGVLRECRLDPNVEAVLALGRTSTGTRNSKLREIIRRDLSNYADLASAFSGFDACFFCLGVSSSGMKEPDYERITSQMTFVYVSGAGTDNSERGRIMWARVKGRTENDLLKLPFAAPYMFRPGIIQPLYGVKSKTRMVRIFYTLAKPFLPPFRWAFPDQLLTTEQIGRAMLAVAARGFPRPVLETRDIRAAAATSQTR